MIGVLVAFPLALLARRRRAFAGPVLGLTTVLYTDALAGDVLAAAAAVRALRLARGHRLVLYSLTILVRNILAGLQAVPEEAREAARGMGYGPVRLLWEVELPLALPAMLAGVRIATVSTVALTTVGAIVDYGGLGNAHHGRARTASSRPRCSPRPCCACCSPWPPTCCCSASSGC